METNAEWLMSGMELSVGVTMFFICFLLYYVLGKCRSRKTKHQTDTEGGRHLVGVKDNRLFTNCSSPAPVIRVVNPGRSEITNQVYYHTCPTTSVNHTTCGYTKVTPGKYADLGNSNDHSNHDRNKESRRWVISELDYSLNPVFSQTYGARKLKTHVV